MCTLTGSNFESIFRSKGSKPKGSGHWFSESMVVLLHHARDLRLYLSRKLSRHLSHPTRSEESARRPSQGSNETPCPNHADRGALVRGIVDQVSDGDLAVLDRISSISPIGQEWESHPVTLFTNETILEESDHEPRRH